MMTIYSNKSLDDIEAEKEYLGETTSELVLYPIDPCRIVDTRIATRWGGGPIPSGGRIHLDVSGFTFNQGGAIACNVHSDAAAVVINVTAIPVGGGDGWLTVWPYGSSKPTASLVNYNAASAANAIANAAVQKICRGCDDELSVYAHRRSHVVIDVLGYFRRPRSSELYKSVRTASRAINALTSANVTAVCFNGYTITGGGCEFNMTGSKYIITKNKPSGNGWFCEGFNNSVNDRTITAYAICNRTPGW